MTEKEKKYFWFKMEEDFFKSKEIKKLRTIAGGDTFVIIYQKMILLSLRNGGKLYFEGFEENICNELSLEIDEKLENVIITFNYLLKHNIISEINQSEYIMNDAIASIGHKTATALRVAKHRKVKKDNEMLQCNKNVTEMKQICNGEIYIEKKIKLEKEIEKELNIAEDLQPAKPACIHTESQVISEKKKTLKELMDEKRRDLKTMAKSPKIKEFPVEVERDVIEVEKAPKNEDFDNVVEPKKKSGYNRWVKFLSLYCSVYSRFRETSFLQVRDLTGIERKHLSNLWKSIKHQPDEWIQVKTENAMQSMDIDYRSNSNRDPKFQIKFDPARLYKCWREYSERDNQASDIEIKKENKKVGIGI